MSLWYRIGRQGAQGELLAAIDLMERGYEVFRAVDPVASTDLIAHDRGRYWRIQVKTGKPALTQIQPGKQEVVAWVDVPTRQVTYDPGLPTALTPMPTPKFDSLDLGVAERIEIVAKANHRAGNSAWFAKLHCENKPCGKASDKYSCDVREIEFYVKEFPNDPPPVRGPFVCPACGGPAKLLSVRGTRDWSEDEDRKARWIVNRQLWDARDFQIEGSSVHARSFDQIRDDRLPGWTECESPLVEP